MAGTSASLYESDKQNPGPKTIDRICQKFGVDKEWLLGETDKAKDKVTDAVKEAEKTISKEIAKSVKEEAIAKPVEKREDLKKEPVIQEEPIVTASVPETPKTELKTEKTEKKTRTKKEKPVETAKEEKIEKKNDETIKEEERVEKAETKKEEKKESVKKSVKTEKAVNVSVMIESAMGGQIALEEIIRRVKEKTGDVKDLAIYVKPEENKAYYTAKSMVGSVDLW